MFHKTLARVVAAMKIDVEGCEIDALLSASGYLGNAASCRQGVARPELFLEVCPYLFARCGTTHAEERRAWGLLAEHGYRLLVNHHDRGFDDCPPWPTGAVRVRVRLQGGPRGGAITVPMLQVPSPSRLGPFAVKEPSCASTRACATPHSPAPAPPCCRCACRRSLTMPVLPSQHPHASPSPVPVPLPASRHLHVRGVGVRPAPHLGHAA